MCGFIALDHSLLYTWLNQCYLFSPHFFFLVRKSEPMFHHVMPCLYAWWFWPRPHETLCCNRQRKVTWSFSDSSRILIKFLKSLPSRRTLTDCNKNKLIYYFCNLFKFMKIYTLVFSPFLRQYHICRIWIICDGREAFVKPAKFQVSCFDSFHCAWFHLAFFCFCKIF